MLRELSFGIVILGVLINTTLAQEPLEYPVQGKEIWSAFECSGLALRSDQPKEVERLFTYGYSKGLEFLEFMQSNKITDWDPASHTPIVMAVLLEGPTPDFVLGRIYQEASDSVFEGIFKIHEYNSNEQIMIIKNEYSKRNCDLIGK